MLRYVVRHRSAWLTGVMRFVTHFGSSAVLVPLSIAVAVLFMTRGARRAALQVVGVYVVANLSFQLMKRLTRRERPPVRFHLVHVTGYSLPSGHATQVAAFCVTIALLAAPMRSRRARGVIWSTASGVIVLVGASRVYLGVHWLSDVIAGWALGAACAVAGHATASRSP